MGRFMRKILGLGSIVAVILLVLVTLNPVINVQAIRTTLVSQLKTMRIENKGILSFFILLILFLAYESGFSLRYIPMGIRNLIYVMSLPDSLFNFFLGIFIEIIYTIILLAMLMPLLIVTGFLFIIGAIVSFFFILIAGPSMPF